MHFEASRKFQKDYRKLPEEIQELFKKIGLKQETYKSGGDVVRTLESLADSSLVLQESSKERKSLLQQYVVLM